MLTKCKNIFFKIVRKMEYTFFISNKGQAPALKVACIFKVFGGSKLLSGSVVV